MAISSSAAVVYSATSSVMASPSNISGVIVPKASTDGKLSNLLSLQLPAELSSFKVRSVNLKSKSKSRMLPLVKAKKQTFNSFEDLVEKSEKPVLVDFYATWCGPCQFMVPILDQVGAKMNDKIQIVKIDTEKYTAIADKYKIAALPTFILFKDGKPYDRFEGAMAADQLIKRIETSLEAK